MNDKRVQIDPTPSEAVKQLGAYLIEAGLLTPAQLQVALNDQTMSDMRFGEILAARGWVKQQTIEYLMEKVILPERKDCRRNARQEILAANLKNSPIRKDTAPGSDVLRSHQHQSFVSSKVNPREARPLASSGYRGNRSDEPVIQISRTQGSVSIIRSLSADAESESEENSVNWVG